MRRCIAIRHVAFEDAGILAGLLVSRGIDLTYIDAGIDPFDKAAMLEADLLVVLGGPIGVYETEAYPFIADEIDILRARLDARKATLGICLGAQMMAAALGARVASGPAKEIGYAPLDLTEAGKQSVLARLAGVAVLHWHGDNIDLPAGAVRLASTKVCPTQAFSVGNHALGLQFHIEMEARKLEGWLIGHAGELSQAGVAPATLRTQASQNGETTSAGLRVLDDWLADVLP